WRFSFFALLMHPNHHRRMHRCFPMTCWCYLRSSKTHWRRSGLGSSQTKLTTLSSSLLGHALAYLPCRRSSASSVRLPRLLADSTCDEIDRADEAIEMHLRTVFDA